VTTSAVIEPKSFLGGKVILRAGDCLEVMAALPDNSVDAIVCDPPYHLTSIVKRFGGENAAACKVGKTGAYARASAGFMGKQWDGGDIAFRPETWAHALRVLKPGGHLVAFSGTRTYHRMTVAIEDAGFEIRDMICWHYGSGFPKSVNVSKTIDKNAGAEREKIAIGAPVKRMIPGADQNDTGSWVKDNGRIYQPGVELPVTDAAKQWDGYGTALKPATEPICLARKPLIGTVVENVLTHGTGALNIDGCRVEANGRPLREIDAKATDSNVYAGRTGAGGLGKGLDGGSKAVGSTDLGRWPANLIHDGSDEVAALFPSEAGAAAPVHKRNGDKFRNTYGSFGGNVDEAGSTFQGDTGSAARFFYTAKADAEDRLGSKHPTVKPLDLMQWLVRLVCPKGGTVLDPFAGTGTTGEAAWREGMSAILIEREEEYQADIARRMDLATKPTKRAAVAKSKNKLERAEDLPLFAGGKA
jgi:site-specific DNA-methyltransferase (adenine-specific)